MLILNKKKTTTADDESAKHTQQANSYMQSVGIILSKKI